MPKLAERGYIETRGNRTAATEAGRSALPDHEPLPTGEDLRDCWMSKLPEGERKILTVLVQRGQGAAVSRAELMEATGYAVRSLTTYVPRLVAKNIVESSRDGVRASDTLF